MRLVSFSQQDDVVKVGALLQGDQIVLDLQEAWRLHSDHSHPALVSMQHFIQAGDDALNTARELVRLRDSKAQRHRSRVRLLAPLPRPEQIRDFVCFEEHVVGSYEGAVKLQRSLKAEPPEDLRDGQNISWGTVPPVWYRQPLYYKANRFAVVGPDVDIEWPQYSAVMDYELEFAAVIGRKAKNVSKQNASQYIFGYTVFNDLSARDTQLIEMEGKLGPAKGKDFDGANVMGPCIVTADEVPDPYQLLMVARVNGKEWSRGNSSSMHWRFEDLIAHVSAEETIHPGEILGSGTVGGGCGLEQGRFLALGDEIELDVEKIGSLKNRIVRRQHLDIV